MNQTTYRGSEPDDGRAHGCEHAGGGNQCIHLHSPVISFGCGLPHGSMAQTYRCWRQRCSPKLRIVRLLQLASTVLYTLSLHGPTCPVYIYCLGIDDARYTNGCEPASCCAGLGRACCLRSPSQCAKAVRTRIQSVLVPNEQTSVYRGAGPEDPRTREHGCSGAALSILYIYIYIYMDIVPMIPQTEANIPVVAPSTQAVLTLCFVLNLTNGRVQCKNRPRC